MWVALSWVVTVAVAWWLGWHVGRERGSVDREQMRLLRWQLAETRTQLYLSQIGKGESLSDREDAE